MGFGQSSGSRKKKISIIALSSIVLVAMVGAVTYGVSRGGSDESSGGDGVSSSTKAITTVCQPTDFKEACKSSLASAKNVSDPKELIKVAFQAAEKNLAETISKSAFLKEAAKDPMAKGAMDVCKDVLHDAIDDLKRSFEKVGAFDVSKMDEYLDDLKTWLSGANTYQETCLDAFQNTTGDTGEKMKAFMKSASQLTSNALAMVSGLNEMFEQLQIPEMSSGRRLLSDDYDYRGTEANTNRRLLSDDYDYRGTEANTNRRLLSSDEIPSFVDATARRLLFARGTTLSPNAIVAKDGSGQYKTISEAIKKVPAKNTKPFIIFVRAGVYKEYVEIPKKVNNVVLVGEGATKTKITGNKNFADGVNTYRTATVAVNGDHFFARDIGFENSAGANKHQAVALRVSGDYAVFYNCRMDGFQDTLYAHTYRQFYRDCTITGTIDFVFGDASAVFQGCKFIVRKPMDNQACMVTAQGRKERRGIGAIVLQKCEIHAEPAFLAAKPALKAYLGRPWKEYSRTIIMNSVIDGFIAPEGWAPWMGTFALNTLYYGEYQNTGAGANTARRVKWKGMQKITPQIAQSFTPGRYLRGDAWIKGYNIPYASGSM